MSIHAIDVSKAVLDAVYALISSASIGINPLWAQQASHYSVDPTLVNFDFTSDPSKNFCLGQVEPEQFELSGNISYPYSCLYVLESMNQNLQKFNTFSGGIRVIYDTHFSWRKTSGLFNFETYGLCMESCVFSLANAWENQAWPASVTYNGGLQCRRGPCTFQGQNWRQKVGFSFVFRVDKY